MCIAIALLLHRIGEEGKKVRGAWDKSGGSGCVSWRARRARPAGAVNGWHYDDSIRQSSTNYTAANSAVR
jgi:hypothetical protein